MRIDSRPRAWRLGVGLACLWLMACTEPVRLDWKAQLGAASRSTPLVTEEFIAVGTELGLTVLEPNGRVRCSFPLAREVVSAPRWSGRLIVFGTTSYVLYGMDPQCREVWRFATADRIKSDALLTAEHAITSSYDGHVYAVEHATGRLSWSFPPRETAAAATVTPGDFSYSSPTLKDGVIYVGNLDHHLYALDAGSGALLWRHATAGPVTSTPAVASGLVYVGSNDGHLYAVDVVSHELRWRIPTNDWVNSSPTLADGTVYFGSNDRHVYAADATTGVVRWTASLAGPAVAIPAVYRNLLFVAGGAGDGAVVALERTTGATFWSYATRAGVESDPVLVGDRLYVSSTDGTLYAFTVLRTTRE